MGVPENATNIGSIWSLDKKQPNEQKVKMLNYCTIYMYN
jgi:hypothetical protein